VSTPRCVKSEGWVRRRCVERAGEFLAQRLPNLFGVLNITKAAVPLFSDGIQAA